MARTVRREAASAFLGLAGEFLESARGNFGEKRYNAAGFDAVLAEFVLPYADVRTAADPDEHLLAFLTSTHDAAAATASWPDPLGRTG